MVVSDLKVMPASGVTFLLCYLSMVGACAACMLCLSSMVGACAARMCCLPSMASACAACMLQAAPQLGVTDLCRQAPNCCGALCTMHHRKQVLPMTDSSTGVSQHPSFQRALQLPSHSNAITIYNVVCFAVNLHLQQQLQTP